VDGGLPFQDVNNPPIYGQDEALSWAVRDGDVSTVPIPEVVLLLAISLLGLVGYRHKVR
jgi:hypothetical protein